MLSSQADPKDLSDWMQLDYFRRPSSLAKWRRRLAWGSLVIGLALGGLLILPPFLGIKAALRVYESQPVSTAHAMFNNDCARCHAEAFRTPGRLGHGNVFRSVEDGACLQCHAGPLHHSEQVDVPSCATCHREHLADTALAHVTDTHCVQCHDGLRTRSGKAEFDPRVLSFPAEHPPFGQAVGGLKDPGTVRFNHQLHLDPQGVFVPVRDLPAGAERPRQVLRCEDCHGADAAGRYMAPVQYDRHCASCHPLSVRLSAPPQGTEKAAEGFSQLPAPHRSPIDVRAALRERLTRFAQTHVAGEKLQAPEAPEPPVPGRRRATPVTEAQWQWVGRELAQVERGLFDAAGGCTKCHQSNKLAEAENLPVLAASNIPTRWMKHAGFAHDTHRMLSCLACHDGVNESKQTRDVLLPGKDLCARCHAPRGGARHDCVECHTYHAQQFPPPLNGKMLLENLGK